MKKYAVKIVQKLAWLVLRDETKALYFALYFSVFIVLAKFYPKWQI